jgi:hypothetical protein
MHLATMGRGIDHRHDADRHSVDPFRGAWLACSGGYREIPMDIEEIPSRVDASDLAHG